MKRILEILGYIIEKKKGIRRFMIFTSFPLWMYLSYVLLAESDPTGDHVQIYTVFSGIIGVIVGFYFSSRRSEDIYKQSRRPSRYKKGE